MKVSFVHSSYCTPSKCVCSNAPAELPPSGFSNAMNDIDPKFDYTDWRKSSAWKIFVAGYNVAVKEANDAVMSRYDLGQTKEKLFGKI